MSITDFIQSPTSFYPHSCLISWKHEFINSVGFLVQTVLWSISLNTSLSYPEPPTKCFCLLSCWITWLHPKLKNVRIVVVLIILSTEQNQKSPKRDLTWLASTLIGAWRSFGAKVFTVRTHARLECLKCIVMIKINKCVQYYHGNNSNMSEMK